MYGILGSALGTAQVVAISADGDNMATLGST